MFSGGRRRTSGMKWINPTFLLITLNKQFVAEILRKSNPIGCCEFHYVKKVQICSFSFPYLLHWHQMWRL